MSPPLIFPDLSNWQKGLRLVPGTPAVIAKATEGTYYTDDSYHYFQAQAASIGATFSAYHFLTEESPALQAQKCFKMVGSTPVMIDAEKNPRTGYVATVGQVAAFKAAMIALGGRVWGNYFPRWCWQIVGGALGSLGLPLIASGYVSAYTANSTNWNPYTKGQPAPDIWQFTNKGAYGTQGMLVDLNAFRGTRAQLDALILGGDDMDANTPIGYPAGADGYFEGIAGGLGQIIDQNFKLGGSAPVGMTLAYTNMRATANLAVSVHAVNLIVQLMQAVGSMSAQLAAVNQQLAALAPKSASGILLPPGTSS